MRQSALPGRDRLVGHTKHLAAWQLSVGSACQQDGLIYNSWFT
jgi:hypothetical protein